MVNDTMGMKSIKSKYEEFYTTNGPVSSINSQGKIGKGLSIKET